MECTLLTMKDTLPDNEIHIANRYGNKPNSVKAETGSATLGAEGKG